MRQTIDLEQLANHRGSAFGGKMTPQPSQASFENALALALLTQVGAGFRSLFFEDESANVGSVHLPKAFLETLRQAPLIVLQISLDQRAELIYQEYVLEMSVAFLE